MTVRCLVFEQHGLSSWCTPKLVQSNAVLSQCFLTLLCLKSFSSRSLWKHGLSAVLVFCGVLTIFYAHWSCNLWSKKCSFYKTTLLHKLGKCSSMLVCREIGWSHKITALCGYSDCYPHVHNPLHCPLSIWAKESSSQIPSLKLPGQREVPQCPEEQLRKRPFGTCNFTKFSYKTVESRLYWFWFTFSIILLSAAVKPQGTGTGPVWRVGAGQLCPGTALGGHWFTLGCSPLRRTSLYRDIYIQIQKSN